VSAECFTPQTRARAAEARRTAIEGGTAKYGRQWLDAAKWEERSKSCGITLPRWYTTRAARALKRWHRRLDNEPCTGRFLAVLPRNSREEIRVSVTESKGVIYVDLRAWYEPGQGGERSPNRESVALRREPLPKILEALANAQQLLESPA
jgi:hypothetical protein